jgi:hypothetical protein
MDPDRARVLTASTAKQLVDQVKASTGLRIDVVDEERSASGGTPVFIHGRSRLDGIPGFKQGPLCFPILRKR